MAKSIFRTKNTSPNTLRRLLVLFISFCFTTIALQAQPIIKKYVEENAVNITISPSDSLDFADLSAVQNAIGDKRIVMLGEQDHGDGATFVAKTRLIKFLHEKMGFDVLAFESDFFLNKGFDEMLPSFRQQPALLFPFLQKSIYSIWSYCDACQPLLANYLPATYTSSHPLLVAGFDNQMYSSYSYPLLAHSLDSVLRANALSVTKRADYATVIYPLLDSLKNVLYWKKDISVYDHAYSLLAEIKKEMEEKLKKDNFWVIVMESLLAEIQEFSYPIKNTVEPKSINIRDEQMAKNLYWLCNVKYPGKKVIVWAANFHVSKYAGHYDDRKKNDYTTMGTVFTQDLQMEKETYIIEFTSYEGMVGRVAAKPYKLPTPKPDDFESWIPKNWKYSFIDLSKLNDAPYKLNEMFYTFLDGHARNKAYWNKVTDGIFFIREMYPCTATVKFSDPKK